MSIIPGAGHTYDLYLSQVKTHIVRHIGNILLTELTPDDIQAMLTKMSQDGLGRTVQAVRDLLN